MSEAAGEEGSEEMTWAGWALVKMTSNAGSGVLPALRSKEDEGVERWVLEPASESKWDEGGSFNKKTNKNFFFFFLVSNNNKMLD